MSMLTERLQVLIEPGQHRRLTAEARHSGVSVGALVREAIDLRIGGSNRAARRQALEEMRSAPRIPDLEPDTLRRQIDRAAEDASDILRARPNRR